LVAAASISNCVLASLFSRPENRRNLSKLAAIHSAPAPVVILVGLLLNFAEL
jgi:hypothetical protein